MAKRRTDTTRLDWLEAQATEIEIDARYLGEAQVVISKKPYGFGNGWGGMTLRDAIDAAILDADNGWKDPKELICRLLLSADTDWTPDQPLRADATDEQIAARWHP